MAGKDKKGEALENNDLQQDENQVDSPEIVEGSLDDLSTDEAVVDEQQAEAPEEIDLADALAKANEEKEMCHDKMLRMAAELENYKKRMTRERDNALKYAAESLIKDILPTIDNLERALAHNPEGDVTAFVEGVDMTLKGLLATLEKAGLTQIESVGQPFDPNLHEAMIMEASDTVADQCIIREFEKGYYYKDRLLRAAKVVVSKGNS